MVKISSLIEKLKSDSQDYSHLKNLRFKNEGLFAWNGIDAVLSYNADSPDAPILLLHEYGHAILNHQHYNQDIELLTMERDAWSQARKQAEKYDITIAEGIIQESLDTYRDWLHIRSICPNCQSTGIQHKREVYACLACGNTWRVNEARTCALRRYNTKKRP